MSRTRCDDLAVPPFFADVRLRFDAESLEAAGGSLRRLAQAAQSVGFDVMNAEVTPAPTDPERSERGTPYAPLTPPDEE
jgi:hypothetical protein